MNKKQLIMAMQQTTNLSFASTERALNELLKAVTQALADDDAVTLVGFGGFSVRRRNTRKGVDPRTGAQIEIAAKNLPKFTAGLSLKMAVADKKQPAAMAIKV